MEGVAEDDPQEGGPRRPAFTVRRNPTMKKANNHEEEEERLQGRKRRRTFPLS